MKILKAILLAVLAALASCGVGVSQTRHVGDIVETGGYAAAESNSFGPSCAAADGCSGPHHCWYGQLEALFLDRDNRSDEVAVILVEDEASSFPGDTVLTTGDADFDWDFGLRAVLGWRKDECRAWEVGYFGIFDWSGSALAEGNNNLAIPGDLGLASLDFFAADVIRLDYDADLHSAEINYVLSYCELSLLAGFRYVSLDEEFNIQATDADTGTSDYNIRTTNDLYGVQIGARFERRSCRWGWHVTGKAGLFGNATEQTQFVTEFPPGFFLRSERSADGDSVAFVGEINLSVIYQLNCVWSLRGGYNLLWIEGVALAPDQLDFTDTATSGTELRDDGGLFAHGVNLGLEARW
jgi:hypothetical protein